MPAPHRRSSGDPRIHQVDQHRTRPKVRVESHHANGSWSGPEPVATRTRCGLLRRLYSRTGIVQDHALYVATR